MAGGPRRVRKGSLEERFWAHVAAIRTEGDTCWEWTSGSPIYGRVRVGRRGSPSVLAHRLSYELHRGSIPSDLLVLHHCDNKPCVNPSHLFLGTKRDNALDARDKGLLSAAQRRRRAAERV